MGNHGAHTATWHCVRALNALARQVLPQQAVGIVVQRAYSTEL